MNTFAAMYYLIGLLIFLVFIIVLANRFKGKDENEPVRGLNEESNPVAPDCCGAHEICEFDESAFNQDEIVYFNDEELDELRNISIDQFSSRQVDDLREVLYTLQPEEISQWLISLGKRRIHLPVILQQEARQLMTEK